MLSETTLILPTEIEGHARIEITPDVWLITNPRWQPNLNKWTALANIGGALAVVELRVYIDTQQQER